VQYVAERARAQPDLSAALPRLRLEDLVLAWGAGYAQLQLPGRVRTLVITASA